MNDDQKGKKNVIRVGIDLGTTNTLACYMKDSKPTIIRFPGGGELLPSVLYLEEDGKIQIGTMAKRRAVMDPLNSIRSSKTEMGNFEKVWSLRDRKFTPTDVAAEILKEVKRNVVKKTKASPEAEIEAVITVPAYFTANQIDETKKAGIRAGFSVSRIITEPRAAAIANIKELGLEKQKIFVVDLGGGTFDVSVLEASKTGYDTIAVDGDRRLGGDDFDRRLYDYILHFIEDDLAIDLSSQEASGLSHNSYYEMVGAVAEAATDAKTELSQQTETEVVIPNIFTYKNNSYNLELTITREKFYQLCEDLFEKIHSRIYKVFQDTPGLKIEDIDFLILAGGSCYIPKIKEDVEQIFHKSADTTMNRSTMVVVGAAFIADSLGDPEKRSEGKDIISHSLGVEIMDESGELLLSKILHRGDEYPCSEKQIFTTSADNQESVLITVYEAGSDKEDVPQIKTRTAEGKEEDIHDLYGSFELTDIQRAPRGVPQIEVTFEYDESRILTVTAHDLKSGAQRSVTIEKGKTVAKTQPSAEQPVDFELLMDASGSMGGSKLIQAKEAACKLATEIIDLQVHRLGVISFGDNVKEISGLSQDSKKLCRCINGITVWGGTRMDLAIREGAEALWTSKKRNNLRKKAILIVTDGAPNSEIATARAAEEVKKNGIDIITIAVGAGNSAVKYLRTLATDPSFAYTINTMDQLTESFQKAVSKYLAKQ